MSLPGCPGGFDDSDDNKKVIKLKLTPPPFFFPLFLLSFFLRLQFYSLSLAIPSPAPPDVVGVPLANGEFALGKEAGKGERLLEVVNLGDQGVFFGKTLRDECR